MARSKLTLPSTRLTRARTSADSAAAKVFWSDTILNSVEAPTWYFFCSASSVCWSRSRVLIAAAVKTRDLDQQTLDAEQKKYQVGASTLFNIVSDQNTLAAAESAEVRARVNLVEGKVNFDRAMARTLEVYNITIADAKSGHAAKDTLIPGTSGTGQLFVDPVKQSASDAASTASNRPAGAGNTQ